MGKRSSKSKGQSHGQSPKPCDMEPNQRQYPIHPREMSLDNSPRSFYSDRRQRQDIFDYHTQRHIPSDHGGGQGMGTFPRSNIQGHGSCLSINQMQAEPSQIRENPQIIMIPDAVMAPPELPPNNQQPATEAPVPKRRCARCCRSAMSFLVSTVGLTCLMIGYTVMGGFIFMKLEAPNEKILKSDVQSSRKWHVEMLWNLTYELNILYPENWTRMADEIMENYTREVYVATKNKGWDGSEGESEVQWTFAGALLYSITVITTIGRSENKSPAIFGLSKPLCISITQTINYILLPDTKHDI